MLLSVFDDWYNEPFVKNSQKTVKQQKWPLVYQSSHVYTASAEYTKPRKRTYLAKPASHVPGQWPQPIARGQGWLYVSTWTSMRLAPVRCRVLLHSLLPTDDACSSSSLSTTVSIVDHQIFHIFGPHSPTFSSPARTPWNTVILKQLHCCHRLNVRDHSSNVELAASGVYPVGMISSHASV